MKPFSADIARLTTPVRRVICSAQIAFGAGMRATGGQAVTEGVMMRGDDRWAVAVRSRDGSITVSVQPAPTWSDRYAHIPVVRGIAGFFDALALGTKALLWSSHKQLTDDLNSIENPDTPAEPENAPGPEHPTDISSGPQDALETPEASDSSNSSEGQSVPSGVTRAVLIAAMVISLVMFCGLFLLLPTLVGHALGALVGLEGFGLQVFEGVLRVAILLGYLWLLGHRTDARRLFQYHGAEHKAVAAHEAGCNLTPDRVEAFSTAHVRCGTNLLLTVMVTTIAVFSLIGRPPLPILLASRIVLLPLVIGLAYEVIRAAARNYDKPWVRTLMRPGLALQRLSTREPARDQVEVAIVALKAARSTSPIPSTVYQHQPAAL